MITGALKSGRVDKVWVIPSGYPPKKDDAALTPAPYRYYMTEAALKSITGCEVLPIELLRPEKSYTTDTLSYIREEGVAGPDDKLVLIYGTDILFELETWYHPERIVTQAELLLARRPGVLQESTLRKATELEEKYGIEISYFPIEGVNISSREIRRTGDYSKLSSPVRQFIARHDLYPKENPLAFLKDDTHVLLFGYETKLMKDLSRERLLHSLNTAVLCVRYAVRYGISPDEAAVAGLLHDCAKQLPIAIQASMAKKVMGEPLPDNSLLHAPAGQIYAAERYGIDNESILSAIRYHTTGRESMTTLEKIVYLADKLEPARDYDDLTAIRALAERDLDEAVIACLRAVRNKFELKKTAFHADSSRALDSLIRRKQTKNDTIAKATQKTEEKMDTLTLANEIIEILQNKKAEDVELIPIAEKTALADYFIIATGTSTTHIKALSDEVEILMKQNRNLMPDHIEGQSTGRWILIDYKDIVVHIFHPEERAHYSLDKLWLTKRPEGAETIEEPES